MRLQTNVFISPVLNGEEIHIIGLGGSRNTIISSSDELKDIGIANLLSKEKSVYCTAIIEPVEVAIV